MCYDPCAATLREIPAVRAALPILIDDPDAKVRAQAVSYAFRLQKPEFETLRTRLQSKLADASPAVRLRAAAGFAERKNPIAAPVLLALLKCENPDINRWWAGENLYRLTGLNRNYDWPTTAADTAHRNAAAIASVEAWLAAHPAQ